VRICSDNAENTDHRQRVLSLPVFFRECPENC
jgi:hypothetical protein